MNSNLIVSGILRHAVAAPFSIAVTTNSERIDYQTLENRSNQLARTLQLRGVTPGSLVGIVLERSTQFVVTALAVWKAGAAYVPVDPAYPSQRIALMLDDSDAALIVTSRSSVPDIPGLRSRLLLIDEESQLIESQSMEPVPAGVDEQSLAYVIYTSGSTGRPNGVEVTHSNVAHLCQWHLKAFNVTAADHGMFAASTGFDAAVWEVWPYLSIGASLHLPDDITRRSPELLRDWLVANQITIAFAPTPLAESMLTLEWPAQTSLRTLLTGADTLHRFPPAGLPFELVNNYGPTECTVVSTSGTIPVVANPTGLPSIGKPVSHADIQIFDTELRPVPSGTVGEIYIGGPGVARGYRNRPELTAERFTGGFYKTGDSGRMLPGGEIEFLGRTDEQIKIRGYRVELGEITSALDRHPTVRSSAVVLNTNSDGDRLVAYLVPRGHAPALQEIQSYLQSRLPEHMIPMSYVMVKDLPTTPHGKLDRASLPEPTAENTLCTVDATEQSPNEKQVTEVLSSLLKTSSIALDDNFFMLGVHSLLGTQLINRLRKLFGVDLTLLTLFENPTARSISAEVERLLALQVHSQQKAMSAVAD